MDFCNTCGSKLYRTSKGNKCKNCDGYDPNQKHTIKSTSIFSDDSEFPYIQGEYYIQKEIRKRLSLGLMPGINPSDKLKRIIVFRNAHQIKPNQTNVYLDHYNSDTEIYHYVGKGLIGDQKLDGANEILKNAKEKGYKVCLFWQHNLGSDHEYVGEVDVVDVKTDTHPDKNGKLRKVYVFLLKHM